MTHRMGGRWCRKRHQRRKRGARPATRGQNQGAGPPRHPADPAQAETQPKAGQAHPGEPQSPRPKPNARRTQPDRQKPNPTNKPGRRKPGQANKPKTRRTGTPGAQGQRGQLANRAQDHFRIAGLQHRAVLLPSKADEPGPISLVELGSPRADEGHRLLGWATPSLEDQRNQLPARGGYRLLFTRTASAAATPSLPARACKRGPKPQ